MRGHRRPSAGRSEHRPAGLAMVAITVMLCGALVALAWPRMQAAVLYLPVNTAIGRYFDTRLLPAPQLDALVVRAEAALLAHEHYRYADGLSLLHYLQALDRERPAAERADALRKSIAAAERSVARAPARPATWLRIAQARNALRQGPERVLPSLELSILSGRVEPTLLLPRLELGLGLMEDLSPPARALLRDQAVLAWRVNEAAFLRALRDERIAWDRVRTLLGPGGADVLNEIEQRM